MGFALLSCFTPVFLLLCLINSGSSFVENPPVQAVRDEKQKLGTQAARMLLSPYLTSPESDSTPGNIPILNPTIPSTPTSPRTPNPATTIPPAAPTQPSTANPTVSNPTSSGGGQWCTASPTASPTTLQVALDYACGYGGADCATIQPGGSCYEPNTIRDHASYAFNDYFQKHPGPTSCDFGGIAQLTSTDPSKGSCHYAASSSKTTSVSAPSPPSPPAYTAPTTTTIPTTTTPTTTTPNTTTPTITTPTTTPTTAIPGGTMPVYGAAEPTGVPNSATSASLGEVLLVAATSLLAPFLAANYP